MCEGNGTSVGSDAASGKSGVGNGLRRRRLLKTTVGGAASVTLAGCTDAVGSIGRGGDSDEPVTIGVLAPNPDSDFIGRSIVRGAEVAVNELNENGGIAGRDVEMIVGDTNESPLEGRRQYQRLILEADADVTVGLFTSEVLINLLNDIAEQQTIHITSGAATPEASRLVNEQYDKYKYHFRAGPINGHDLGRLQMDFLDSMGPEIGWNSVAVLAEDYKWTEPAWDVYQDRLGDLDVEVALQQRYPPATDDFSGIYDEVADADADSVFISTAHTGTAALLDWVVPEPRPFAFGGIHVPMQLPGYYDLVNGACRFAISQSSATAKSERTERTKPFITDYQDAYNGSNPVYTGYHTYDAVVAFADAVQRAESLDSEDLVPTLEETKIPGAAGTIEFYDPDHEFAHDLVYDPNEVDSVYFQWQENDEGEGVQEIIWPREQATSEYIAPPWL